MATTSPQAPRAPQKPETPPAPPAASAEVETTKALKPIQAFRYGRVSAAVFVQSFQRNGQAEFGYNVSLRRSFRDAQGKWHWTHTLRAEDLPPAAVALQKCYEFILDEMEYDEGVDGPPDKEE